METQYVEIISSLQLHHKYKEKMLETVKTLIECKEQFLFKEIWLFGSCARQKIQNGSDIDLLLLVDDTADLRNIAFGLDLMDLRDDTAVIPVDIIVRRYSSIEDDTYVFNKYVKRDRIVLWCKD